MALKTAQGRARVPEASAAVTRVRERVDAIFHDRANAREATEQAALDALRLMYEAMGSDDVRVRTQAARDVLYVWGRLPAAVKDVQEGVVKPLTRAEREEKLAAALDSTEVREWLAKHGWTAPTVS